MSYRRAFDASGDDSLAKLARWLRPGGCVLELGSASGYFTAFLASRAQAVDIVEIDAEAAAQASPYARRTVVADLDGDDWLAQLGDARYDTIVCADVLEHLREGKRLLERLRGLLAPGGELLLSVPNVAHSAVIAGLVDDRFDYGGEGLLDPTHVRLYTWRSLAALLRDCGFGIREWDATTLAPFDTEFRVRTEALAPGLRQALAARPRGHVYQWLVRATPSSAGEQPEAPLLQPSQAIPLRLLYAPAAEALTLERSALVRIPVGDAPREVEWRIGEPSAALRLLLADRSGVIRVHACRLFAADELLWSLGEAESYVSASVVRIDAVTYALTAPDAWIAPVLPPGIAMRADRMTATLAWPAGIAEAGEFAALSALAAAYEASVADAAQFRHRMLEAEESGRIHAHRHASEATAHAAARAALENVQAALAKRNAHVDHLEQAIEGYRAENRRLDAAVTAQERIIGYRQSLRWWLRLPFVRVKLLWHRWTSA